MNIDEKFLKFKWISFHSLWKGKYNHDDSVGWASGITPHIPCRWLSSQSWIAYTHTQYSHEDLTVLSADVWSPFCRSLLYIFRLLRWLLALSPPGCPVLTADSGHVVTGSHRAQLNCSVSPRLHCPVRPVIQCLEAIVSCIFLAF